MKEEYKQLSLQQLCSSFQYGLKVKAKDEDGTVVEGELWSIEATREDTIFIFLDISHLAYKVGRNEIKPYLRPLSSMTEEEKKEYKDLLYCVKYAADTVFAVNMLTNWLDAHHFDHRGLIPKGLAIEAPIGMYTND